MLPKSRLFHPIFFHVLFLIHDNFLLVSFSVMSSRIRRHPSGHEKRQNKKKVEEFNRSQRGALDKFLAKESNVLPETQSAHVGTDDIHGDDYC
jgi:hypothetical protein